MLDAFHAVWSQARQTFGAGTPHSGAQYDHSASFRRVESELEHTAPGDQWTGTAADAYAAVNTEHRRVIGRLADLDQRLGAQVDQTAQIVTVGRRDLQTVHDAVAAVAAKLPPGPSGDALRYALVSHGTGQLNDIVRRSNSALNTVGATIRALGDEYRELGNQKFGNGPEKSDTEHRRTDRPTDPR